MILYTPLRRASFLMFMAFVTFSGCAPAQQSLPTLRSDAANSVDPQGLIPTRLREEALEYFQAHKAEVTNQDELTIVEITESQPLKTFYRLHLQSGTVEVSHNEFPEAPESDSLIYTTFENENKTASLQAGSTLTAVSSPQADNGTSGAPLWEAARPEDGSEWTEFTGQTVQSDGANLLAGSKDMSSFCPNYSNLSSQQKIKFWVYLISAVVRYESGFHPTSRFREAGLGVDPVTGQHVYSEGLLQLSYQDKNPYPSCNEFNWSVDRSLSPSDPRKTIFDPHKNLRCGVRILDHIIGDRGVISSQGHYWATLKPRNSSKRAIQALTNKLAFCHR